LIRTYDVLACAYKRDVKVENGAVSSADGTSIGYVKMGAGPPVVIVHGSLCTHEDWMAVARELCDQLTGYVMDRRGRGLSGDSTVWSGMIGLMPVTRREMLAVDRTGPSLERFAALEMPTRLLLGSQSHQPRLRDTTPVLAKLVPNARLCKLTGHGHGANVGAKTGRGEDSRVSDARAMNKGRSTG
jgi:pimeloyl-ACP methyl ester carboxylesterase